MSSLFEASGTAAAGLDFLLLGRLEVRRDGTRLELGPPKQRAVLALLLLHANRVVPTARLIDELWGESPPESARAALQVYVAGLRKALGDGQATLSTKAPGYVLTVAPGTLDLDRFDRLRDEARSSNDPARRAALLHESLDLWRDTPLGEFDAEPFAVTAAGQLEERRLATLEERVDADLALGRHADVVTELEALVREHPYRERFRGQLMLALYRSGRQADALAAYRATREAFASGLGLEPGPELKALEHAVLEQDPALELPRATPPAPPEPTDRRRPRGLSLAVVGAVVAVAAAAIAGLLVLTGDDEPAVVVPPNSVAVIDPATNRVIDVVQVGLRPGPITAGPVAIWVGNEDDRNLQRIDGGTRRPAGTVDLQGRTPTGLAFDRGTVWVAHGRLGSVSLVDARFGAVTRLVEVTEKGAYSSAGSIAAGADGVWAVFGDGTLARLDRVAGDVTGKAATQASPVGVADGYGWVWVVSAVPSTVERFSRRTLDEAGSLTVSGRPAGVVGASGDIWVTSEADDIVYRIDVGGRSIGATIPVGHGPTAIASGAASVWVANRGDGTVSRIDPAGNEEIERIPVGGAPAGVVVARNLVWVTVQAR